MRSVDNHHSLSTRLFVLLILFFFSMVAYSYVDATTEKSVSAADMATNNQKIDLNQQKYRLLFKELHTTYHFSRHRLQKLFNGVSIDKKVLELMDKQWEAKPYYQYRTFFITPDVIATGKEKLEQYKPLLDKIERRLGVDREVVVAIWGVETRFGTHLGHYPVFTTLNTLFDAYPRRSAFFRKQLIQFLLLCRDNHMNPLDVRGSYAGAFGQTQFMPSSFRQYAISFDGNNQVDVFTSVDDILASIANYLHRYHWVLHAPIYRDIGSQLHSKALIAASHKGRAGLVSWKTVCKAQGISLPKPPDNDPLVIFGLEVDPDQGGGFRYIAGYKNFQAITAWNNSNRYAMVVAELAADLKK